MIVKIYLKSFVEGNCRWIKTIGRNVVVWKCDQVQTSIKRDRKPSDIGELCSLGEEAPNYWVLNCVVK